MITIKNLRKEKPATAFDVVVCRGKSVLGNPFHLDFEADRDSVCDKYQVWFDRNKDGCLKPELTRLLDILKKNRVLNLFCWCAPKRCHAETIKKWLLSELGESHAD